MNLSKEEIQAGALSAENLEVALRTLSDVGYVVLEEVIPLDWVEQMRSACDEDLKVYFEAEVDEATHKQRGGNVSMLAPYLSPYTDAVAIENPFACQIMAAAMGDNYYCTFYNTNTAWPGSEYQRIHRDIGHIFPEYPSPLPVAMIVVNIPLVDFTLENGSTEVWPGTHLITDRAVEDGQKLLERAALLPSARTNLKAGSLVVRDMRMWHRGMPNTSNQIRTMLALVYCRGFWIPDARMRPIPRTTWEGMSERARKLFRHNPVAEA